VLLTNTLATNLFYVGVTSTQGGCVNEGRIVRCDLGAMPGGTGGDNPGANSAECEPDQPPARFPSRAGEA
jgi:hypothetical protein